MIEALVFLVIAAVALVVGYVIVLLLAAAIEIIVFWIAMNWPEDKPKVQA